MDASINKQNNIKSNNNVDEQSVNAASNVLDIGLAREIHLIELQNVQAFVAHKEHEVSVYENARRLIECQTTGDRCMVFLADNLFVLRTREQALEILDRQINVFQNALKYFRQERAALSEKVALMERLSITNEGLVEIREPENEDNKQSTGQIKGKRIQHVPKNSPSNPCSKDDEANHKRDEGKIKNPEEDIQKPPKPRGVSDKDYERFVKLVDSIELSDNEEDKNDEDGDENNEEMDEEEGGEENNDEHSKQRRHVHFSDKLDEQPVGMKKERSILKNKNEHSPIDSVELKKIDQKEQRRIYSVSKEIFKDEIIEHEQIKSTNKNAKTTNPKNVNKKQKKDRRPISRWKAQRDGLLHESDDDYEDPFVSV